jgi:hypothetical protein
MGRSSLLLLFLAFAVGEPANAAPASSDNPPPLPALLNGVIARDAETQRELKNMAYDELVHTERLDATGQVTQHQDLQLIFRPGVKQELQVVSVHGDDLPTDPDEAARQAKGKEIKRRQQTLDLKALSTRFNLTLQGTCTDLGTTAYIVAFEPKPNQPYHSQTEKVLNQLHGRIWVRASDDIILRTQATLLHPVQVAWIFASITRLDFRYELPAGGSDFGPAWLETTVDVHAPMILICQHQRIDMTHFRPRDLTAPVALGSAGLPTVAPR